MTNEFQQLLDFKKEYLDEMELTLVPVGNVFKLATDIDADNFRKLKQGELVSCTVKRSRNLRHHRKFFAMLQLVFDNLPHGARWLTPDNQVVEINTVEDLLFQLKLKLGHVERRLSLSGVTCWQVKSISFGAMSQTEFEDFYDRSIDVLIQYFLPVEKQDLIDMVAQEFGG